MFCLSLHSHSLGTRLKLKQEFFFGHSRRSSAIKRRRVSHPVRYLKDDNRREKKARQRCMQLACPRKKRLVRTRLSRRRLASVHNCMRPIARATPTLLHQCVVYAHAERSDAPLASAQFLQRAGRRHRRRAIESARPVQRPSRQRQWTTVQMNRCVLCGRKIAYNFHAFVSSLIRLGLCRAGEFREKGEKSERALSLSLFSHSVYLSFKLCVYVCLSRACFTMVQASV